MIQKRRRWLRDIVGYAEAIFKRIEGETSETFLADADFHDAVYYRLQCISEATRNLLLVDPGIVERHAEIRGCEYALLATSSVTSTETSRVRRFGQPSQEAAFGISYRL